jgi:hypothetical protein
LLAGYLLARVVFGALLNPPLNGPDEAGHLQYVRTLVETGGRHVTGVESRQPPTYYLLAALLWQTAQERGPTTQLFFIRLLNTLCGLLTLIAAWSAARLVWPARPALAIAVAAAATLAPGHLFLLASANNDPLAAAFAAVAVLAALHLWGSNEKQEATDISGVDEGRKTKDELASALCPSSLRPDQGRRFALRRWLAVWFAASIAAMATKLTAVPLVLALAGALIFHWRHRVFQPRWVRLLAGFAAAALLASYAFLLTRHPTSSLAASAARFWPLAILRAPSAYVGLGGLAESFRTFWYAYDYAVRWPRPLEAVLAGSAIAISALAFLGLILERPLPWLVWAAAGVQVAFVVGRYGLGDLLHVEMGGAGQAKAFFPALVPLALLLVAGLAATGRRLRLWDDRWLALGLFGWLFALDVASLALTTWQQYRWWQVGL